MVKRRKVDRRMVIISLDAVGARDLAYLKTLPNFQKLHTQSGYCDHVESVYPSITYPAHTSIVTGKKPLHHGVVNNLRLQPGRKSRTGCGRSILSMGRLYMKLRQKKDTSQHLSYGR